MAMRTFTAMLQREGDGYMAVCPELDVSSQGDTLEKACANLCEAVELLLKTASPEEIDRRLRCEVYLTSLEVEVA